MSSLFEKTWEVGDNSDDIFAAIPSVFNVSVSAPTASTFIFLDDFDRDLWRAGCLFYKTSSRQFTLVDVDGNVCEINSPNNSRFWWDFFKEKNPLQKLIGLRAVMPVASLKYITRNYLFYNEDQKIVLKAYLTQIFVEKTTANYFTLQGLRGYKKHYHQIEKIVNGLAQKEIDNFGLKFILSSHASHIFNIHKTADFSVNANMPAEDFVRKIALGLLDAAKAHVEGTVQDVDTEFLHQFRVNFRKLRSLVSLLKKSLPLAMSETLRSTLASIARRTNKLRDLDVFLLDENKYRQLLPISFECGLSEFYTLIRKQRKSEQKKLANYFLSEDYHNEIVKCAQELSQLSTFETDIASKPILQVAKKLLLKRYRKMLAISIEISGQSPDEDIHALRIEFKKFRYLIEFIIDFMPEKTISVLISEIKKMQSLLGSFNDYSTQVDFLKNYVDDDKIEMSKSLSGLIAILHQKQIEEKQKVNDSLTDFFTESMTDKINMIFGSNNQSDSE